MTHISKNASSPRTLELTAKLDATTKSQHDMINEKGGAILFSETLTLLQYRKLLERFYSFYSAFEQRYEDVEKFDGWNETGLSLAKMSRMPFLKKDLINLGATADGIDQLPRFQRVNDLFSSVPQVLGALYASEGGAVGGQFIAPQLEQSGLHITVECGGAYFKGYGPEQTMTMWRQFCQAIDSYALQYPAAEETILQTARAHFAALTSWVFEPTS